MGRDPLGVDTDLFVRGNADAETLWQGLVHGANNQHPKQGATGRWGAADYNTLGYVAHDKGRHGTVARTLEYAYDDWCIWQFGKAIGKSDDETAQYRKNSGNWRNVIDPKHRLANGRWRDGKFRDDFNPIKWGDGDFVEGNSLHWTWSVVHDVAGLKEAMGGREAFVAALDDVLARPPSICESDRRGMYHEMREMLLADMGQYAHGNQPAQHMLYLYDWAGEPWKTQYWVRETMDRLYSPTPDGYCGDEDNGQTSAWYVWSALGFYPVCPASGQYALGSPRTRRDTHAVRQDACHRGEGRIAQPLRRRGGLQRQGGERELAFGGGSGERRQTRVQDVVQTRQDARHHTRGGALFHEQG